MLFIRVKTRKVLPDMANWFEKLTHGLLSLSRGRIGSSDVIPVQVDLVGNTVDQPRLNKALPAAQSPHLSNPFLNDQSQESTNSNDKNIALTSSWSFREAVVLNPTNQSSRILLYVAIGFTGVGVFWLLLAPLNQTVLVQGKLEPNTKVKTIQTPVTGVVDEVLVEEGEKVNSGQILLRFDLRDSRSKLRAAETIRTKLVDENRIFALALGDSQAKANLSPNQLEQLRNQADDFINRQDAAAQELQRSGARLIGLRKALATSSNIASRYEQLVRSGAVSEVQRLEMQAKVDELKSSIEQELREQARLKASQRSSSAAPNAEFRGRIETNLRAIAEQDALIRDARLQLQYSVLRAPAAGTVFNLEVRRGSVAQAAQPLLKIVPDGALQAKIYVPSAVIGFIHVGQLADISLDTFPAADYGRLEATVKRIGTDALTPEQQKETLGTESSGLHFPAILLLKRQSLQAGNKQIPLQPGMGLGADIHLRQRKMISIFTGFFEDKQRELERMR